MTDRIANERPTRGQTLLNRMLAVRCRLQTASANHEKALAGIRGPRLVPTTGGQLVSVAGDQANGENAEHTAFKAFFPAAERLLNEIELAAAELEAAPKELTESLF